MRLVLVDDRAQQLRDGNHDMGVRHRQQLGLTLGKLFIGDDQPAFAVVVASDVAIQRRASASLNCRRCFQLAEAYMASGGLATHRTDATEDIRHFERRM